MIPALLSPRSPRLSLAIPFAGLSGEGDGGLWEVMPLDLTPPCLWCGHDRASHRLAMARTYWFGVPGLPRVQQFTNAARLECVAGGCSCIGYTPRTPRPIRPARPCGCPDTYACARAVAERKATQGRRAAR